jgi:hypothetical protein
MELRDDLRRPADRARRSRLSERTSALVPARKGDLARRVRRTRRVAGDAIPTRAVVLRGWEAAFQRASALVRRQGAARGRAALRVRRGSGRERDQAGVRGLALPRRDRERDGLGVGASGGSFGGELGEKRAHPL